MLSPCISCLAIFGWHFWKVELPKPLGIRASPSSSSFMNAALALICRERSLLDILNSRISHSMLKGFQFWRSPRDGQHTFSLQPKVAVKGTTSLGSQGDSSGIRQMHRTTVWGSFCNENVLKVSRLFLLRQGHQWQWGPTTLFFEHACGLLKGGMCSFFAAGLHCTRIIKHWWHYCLLKELEATYEESTLGY